MIVLTGCRTFGSCFTQWKSNIMKSYQPLGLSEPCQLPTTGIGNQIQLAPQLFFVLKIGHGLIIPLDWHQF